MLGFRGIHRAMLSGSALASAPPSTQLRGCSQVLPVCAHRPLAPESCRHQHLERSQASTVPVLGSSRLSRSTRPQRDFSVLLFFGDTSIQSSGEVADAWRWSQCVLAGVEQTQLLRVIFLFNPISLIQRVFTHGSPSKVLTHTSLEHALASQGC